MRASPKHMEPEVNHRNAREQDVDRLEDRNAHMKLDEAHCTLSI